MIDTVSTNLLDLAVAMIDTVSTNARATLLSR